jgi:hypothetical protein
MLFLHRRLFVGLSFLPLATPLVGIVAPDSPASMLKDGRTPADAGDHRHERGSVQRTCLLDG